MVALNPYESTNTAIHLYRGVNVPYDLILSISTVYSCSLEYATFLKFINVPSVILDTINAYNASQISTSNVFFDQGIVTCNTNNFKYSVSHSIIPSILISPIVSLTIPTSSSVLYVQGITNRKINSFDVILSDIPSTSGYYINWAIPVTGTNTGSTTITGSVNPNGMDISNSIATVSGSNIYRTMRERFSEVINVKDFGAKGDGLTDDSSAIQLAFDTATLNSTAKPILFPPGEYLMESQVTLKRGYINGINTSQNLVVYGYGAILKTNGNISAFKISCANGGAFPPFKTEVYGFAVDHTTNPTALAGFECEGTVHVTMRECTVLAQTVSSGYSAFWLHNAVPSNPNTGCFWTLLDTCTVRILTNGGSIPNAIKLQGACNATNIFNCSLGPGQISGNNAILIEPETSETYISNAVLIHGCHFEGADVGINVKQHPSISISGLRIIANRFESLNALLSLTGTTSQPAVPTFLMGNWASYSVSSYVHNPNELYVTSFDSMVTPNYGTTDEWIWKKRLRGLGTTDVLEIRCPTTSTGISLTDFNGNLLSKIRYNSNAGGSGTVFSGSYSISGYRPLGFAAVGGISSRDTIANNLTGYKTFSANISAQVTFPVAESDATYGIFLDNPINQKLWVTNKTTAGFTINSDTSNSNVVRWLLIR